MSSGLVVSRLGVQASASEDVVHGLICLRVSIPKDNDANHALRWNLFSSKPPKLVSSPSILPLPLPLAVRSSSTPRTSRFRALAIASTLLGLPTPSSYPPSRAASAPHLDVSSSSGQVCVVLPSTAKGKARHPSGSSGNGKTDWVIIMEFEQPVEQGSERGFSKVLLSLPKCLHSIIRFQVTPPTAGPSTGGEVSIMTEPKMLALPPSTFSSPATPFPRRPETQVGFDDGWEDGEDLRDGQMSDTESDGDDSGSWLEGRFQATPRLRLEWSVATTINVNTLEITPRWDPHRPSIYMLYEQNTPATTSDQLVPIELIAPDGWAWRDLDISGTNLVSWRSTDSDQFSVQLKDYEEEEGEEGPDDSFSTIRNVRAQTRTALGPRTHTSASLMKQTLPVAGDLRVDDFSFEMTSGDNLTIPASIGSGGSRPGTPSRFSPGPNSPAGSTHGPIGFNQPVDARCFDLIFAPVAEDRTFVMEGTLVPLSPLTLVSGSAPMRVPFIRSSSPGECLVQCPNSTAAEGETSDTARETVGTFDWTDASGLLIPPTRAEPINGHVRVRLFRDVWGSTNMSILFPWPERSTEVAFSIAGDHRLRIAKADIEGIALPRSVTQMKDGESEVRLGRGPVARTNGRLVEVALEVGGSDGDVPLPIFSDAQGNMTVELRGNGWESLSKLITSPFIRSATSVNTFHSKLPVNTYLIASSETPRHPGKASRTRTLFSLSTFFYLFLLWLVISLGQQVQRLRTEISFVAEEARDLRMYGFEHRSVHAEPVLDSSSRQGDMTDTILPDGSDLLDQLPQQRNQDRTTRNDVVVDTERSLGRVVFGHTGWQLWANHPTVRTLSKGVTRVWEAFVWLLGRS